MSSRNYPCWRGDDARTRHRAAFAWELPPLARGRPVRVRGTAPRLGTTPAGAGTTCFSARRAASSANYPRWRGDDGFGGPCGAPDEELPPLARGRPAVRVRAIPRRRTTPAGTGTTQAAGPRRLRTSNYPRWRGDDQELVVGKMLGDELPPLADGVPPGGVADQRTGTRRSRRGLRPAEALSAPDRATSCAAPTERSSRARYRRVKRMIAYITSRDATRWRGNDPREIRNRAPYTELPPLARGRPRHHEEDHRGPRATPAGAGTTAGSATVPPVRGNYPRWLGDDGPGHVSLRRRGELPPLARGRPARPVLRGLGPRTTPAGAGTTSARRSPGSTWWNYPRWRGDDSAVSTWLHGKKQLPPLARGRPGGGDRSRAALGTTPAGAGTTTCGPAT